MKVTFKAARVNANVSQAEAAEYLGVSTSTLIRWEQGGRVPLDAVLKMCGLYKCSVDDFVLASDTNFKEGWESDVRNADDSADGSVLRDLAPDGSSTR